MLRWITPLLLATLTFACDSVAPTTDEAKTAKDPYSTEGVQEGDSCKGIGPAENVNTCDGRKTLGCSSFTGYTWTLIHECEEGTKCVREGANLLSCS